jgi:phenylacetate-CoA ligase
LRESLPEIISGGKVLASWDRRATGGTTSSPVTFYCDKKALWKKDAYTQAMDCWFGKQIGDKIVFLWGAHQDFSGSPTLGMRLRNLAYQRRLILPSSPLDDEILRDYYSKIVEWGPSFLQAYPTPLYEFCLFLQKHRLKLPSLEGVSVTAEVLYQEQRHLIEETLGLRVFNWYGSRELGRVASECKLHDGLHINEPSLYVEIESDSSLPGDCGHLIVTDLFNRATPLIRYRTGDVARFVEGECPCGRSLRKISAVEGRLTDMIFLPNGRKVPGVSLTNRVVKNFEEISELQIIQKGYTSFTVRYVRGPKFSASSLEKFLVSFYDYIDTRVVVTFEEVHKIPIERSGKVRFVINEMNLEQVSV